MTVPHDGRPDWAKKIEEMREALGLSQAALAKTLNVSPMAPSRWERGINRPPSSIFLRLGKLIGHPLCWYFWGQAGLSKEDLMSCTDPAEIAQKLQVPASIGDDEYIKLPVLPKETTSFLRPLNGHRPQLMIARRDWCPNPEQTICWEYRGEGMKPLLADASIVAIDLSQTAAEKLEGKMILAQHPKFGPRVKWLLKEGSGFTLKPENPDVPSHRLKPDEWKIIGRVIWWFRKHE